MCFKYQRVRLVFTLFLLVLQTGKYQTLSCNRKRMFQLYNINALLGFGFWVLGNVSSRMLAYMNILQRQKDKRRERHRKKEGESEGEKRQREERGRE